MTKIEEFINDTRAANLDVGMQTMTIQVRDVRLANSLGVRQLRSKKNRWVAVVWSDMDVCVLTRSGKRYQLDHEAYVG